MGRTEEVERRGHRGRTRRKLAPHGDEAQPREHRQQQRSGKQHQPGSLKPGPAVECKMQTETAVQPARREQAQLPALLARGPEIGDHTRIGRIQSIEVVGQPRRRDVTDQQDRHREAERNADQFERRQAQSPPLVHGHQRHHEMNGECAVEHRGAGQAVPDLDGDAHSGFGGFERHQPERVIDQMRGDVKEQDQAGRHPQVPADRAGEPLREQWDAPCFIRPGVRRDASQADGPSACGCYPINIKILPLFRPPRRKLTGITGNMGNRPVSRYAPAE